MNEKQFMTEKLDQPVAISFGFYAKLRKQGKIKQNGIVGNCYLYGRATALFKAVDEDCPNLILVPGMDCDTDFSVDKSKDIIAMSRDDYNDLPWDPCDDFERIRAAGSLCGWEIDD